MASQSPMYRAFVEVVPEASGFTGALTGQVTAGAAAAGNAGGKAAAGGMVAGLGRALPLIGAGIAALGLGDIIGDAISDGANYEQAVGAVEDVFEGASAEIIKFSKSSAKAFGLSSTQALVGAKDFGIFGRAAGLTGPQLAAFSTELLALGSDLAAFGNTTPEEAVTALGAGLRGESEPLRRYGVLLDDAKLRARALEMGIYDGNGALTSQQKILAAQAEILAQTSIQQGQFARESDTLAAKQAVLAASWEDVSTKIGTAFLPVAQELVTFITNDMVPALEEFSVWLNDPKTQDGIKNFTEGARETGNFIRDYIVNPLTDSIGVVSTFADFLNGVSFDQLTAKLTALPGFWGMAFRSVEDGAVRIGTALGWASIHVKDFAADVGEQVAAVILWFQTLPTRILAAVADAGQWLYDSGRAVVGGFLDGVSSMWESIGDTMGGVMDFIAGFFPQSPAQYGAFSGSGWTDLAKSGAAMVEQVGAGIEAQARSFKASNVTNLGSAVGGAVAGPSVEMTVNAGPDADPVVIGRVAADQAAWALRAAV